MILYSLLFIHSVQTDRPTGAARAPLKHRAEKRAAT
jgi:hypothetical protein